MNKSQVVVTGMGVISVLGNTLQDYWTGLVAGRSGISRITQFDPDEFPCQIGGEVKEFDPGLYIDRKEARRMARSSQFAVAAAVQAVADAELPEKMPNPERAGVVFGTAIGGLERITDGIEAMKTGGYTKVNPFVLPSGLPNMPAFVIANQLRCLGPNTTITTACATSTQTIGEGTELIRRGAADVVIVGGVESLIKDFAWAGFCAMRAMPVNFNDRPEAASRPFNLDREGFVYSEGAGALVLESAGHAQARGARVYAEVLGHSSSADAFHMAAIDPSGNGAIRAMRWAMQNAGIQPDAVGYVNTHGSSTPLNDVMETNAIKTVFGDEHAYKMAISSTKSMIGHALGATGALEAIACIKAIETGYIPPTINYEKPDPECDLDYVPNVARQQTVDIAMSNSFGLGGQNACVVLGKFGGFE